MREHAKMNFMGLGQTAPASQGGSQAAFETRDRAFNLGSVAVSEAVEPPIHLAAVFGSGPALAAAAVEVDDRAADTQFLACKDVVVFGVVAGVGQHAVQRQSCLGLAEDGSKQRRVLAGPVGDHHINQEVGGIVAGQGQFGPASHGVAFLAGPPGIVVRARTGIEPGRVDAGFRARFDEPALCRLDKYRVHKLLVRTFFNRRCCAL